MQAMSLRPPVRRLPLQPAAIKAALADAERAARPLQTLSRRHAELVRLLDASGWRAEALAVLESTRKLHPGSAEDFEALAFAAYGLGQHRIARDYYAEVTRAAEHDALAWYNLATSERNLGNLQAAEAACERALALQPACFQAHLLRSQLFTQSERSNHVEELVLRLTQHGRSLPGRIFLNYALGKECDDLGRYQEAFRYFAAGAAARRQSLNYDVAQDLEKLRRIVNVFGRDRLETTTPEGDPDFAFVIGLPRSGTTLIERVLTGHPKARSNGETDNLAAALMASLPCGGGDVFERAASADAAKFASSYAARAEPFPSSGVTLEKLPMNYLYVGAANRAMPQAKFIAVRRNPIANCFAMYSTLFGSAYPFSYDFDELVAYCAAHQALMNHWKQALPEHILEVRYEAFVAAPLKCGPAIARHLGLDWTDDMARVERNSTPSATASAVQIRQPIYTHAIDRWRNYLPWLQPLADKLASVGMEFD